MRYVLLFLLITLSSCSPKICGKWISGNEYISIYEDHFKAGTKDTCISKPSVLKSYDWDLKKYINKAGPGQDTIFYDRICVITNKDTFPYLEYLLRPDTLFLNIFGDSTGTMYFRAH